MKMKSAFRPVTAQNLKKGVKTIWQYSRQLFAMSGVNGVSHIALAKSNGRRVLWMILFAIGIIGWFYQTTTLLEHYYKYPTVVKIEVEKEPVMDFPGLTICNVNRIRKSQYCHKFPNHCASNASVQLSEDEMFNITFEYMKRGEKSVLGHQIQDMLISCHFSGTPKLETESCLEYFAYIYDPHLGNCYVFSSDGRKKLKVTEPDAWQDIKDMDLVLNMEQDEYLDQENTNPGMILTVHEDMSYPQIFSHGIHVHAEHIYHLAVEKVTVYLLSSPYKTNCTDYIKLPFSPLSKLEPTPRICTVECLLHYQQKECGHGYVTDNVVLFTDEMPYDPKKVTAADIRCANRLSKNFKHYCSTLCGVPCHDVHFTMSIDSSPASEKSEVDETELEEYKKRTRSDKQVDVAHVKIHFQSMEHRVYRHSPEYTTEILFSYLGGITGGWLGISLLEFCAFVEGVMSVFIFSFRYCRPARSRNRKKKGRRTPRKAVPVGQPQCNCQCRTDFGSLLLAVPVENDTPRTVQVVPFEYY